MEYACPLCGQRVSATLYRKITGIWKERQRLLGEIREQRAKLAEKAANFGKQKARLIQQAVDRRTKRQEFEIEALRQKIRKAQNQAKKLAVTRFNLLKRQLHASFRVQLKRERERSAQQVQKKYERMDRTFRSTLAQMRSKDTQLRNQANQIRELEKELERQTTPQIEGLLYENNLIRELRKRFPEDRFLHTGKGGDIIQSITRKGQEAGVIVYECKRVKHYSARHVKQAFEAKEKRKADFAILVTNAMKKGTHGFFTEREVMVVHATGVLSLANFIRNQIIRIAEMKLGQLERDKATKLTLEYLEGSEFANSMDSIIQETMTLYNELMDEVSKHVSVWKRRYSSCKKVYEEAFTVRSTAKALLSGEPSYKKLVQRGTLPALVELPEVQTGNGFGST